MKHFKLYFPIAILVVLVSLGFYAKSIWPQNVRGDESRSPTKSISNELGIGGVAVETDKTDDEKKTESLPSDTNTRTNEPQPVAFEDIAPKQAEITKSTPVEYLYRALRASNDPIQQPSWAQTATKMQTAWDRSVGNGVIVAVIDSGFALSHEDLSAQWYQNPAESGMTSPGGRCWTGTAANKATNDCDDDANGYRDDWRGWDFVGVNNLPQAGESNPNGAGVAHGTEVAGLVGATGNNGIGTATVAWNNTIMPLQALSDDGSGYTSSITSAVYYAVDNGASVINMSLGGDTDDPTLAAAIRYAYDRGVVVVAAAGNCGTGNEQGCDPTRPGAMGYPALNPYVIAVGATTSTNARASFSSYGPGLDAVAPGSGNLISPMWRSTNQTSAYATSLYGTSFASPIVASYVGLIKSIRPSTTVDDITALVNATTSKPTGMAANPYTIEFGHGIIDAEAGLRIGASLNLTSATPDFSQAGSNVSEHTFQTSSTVSSGCRVAAGSYCTVWAKNSLGYDRYLPYTQTDANGQSGWSWPGTWLGSGEWLLKARQGTNVSSTPYQLMNK